MKKITIAGKSSLCMIHYELSVIVVLIKCSLKTFVVFKQILNKVVSNKSFTFTIENIIFVTIVIEL